MSRNSSVFHMEGEAQAVNDHWLRFFSEIRRLAASLDAQEGEETHEVKDGAPQS